MKVRIRKDLVPNQRSLVDDDDDDDDDAEDDEDEGHGHSHGGARGGHQHGKHGAGGVSSLVSPMLILSSLSLITLSGLRIEISRW